MKGEEAIELTNKILGAGVKAGWEHCLAIYATTAVALACRDNGELVEVCRERDEATAANEVLSHQVVELNSERIAAQRKCDRIEIDFCGVVEERDDALQLAENHKQARMVAEADSRAFHGQIACLTKERDEFREEAEAMHKAWEKLRRECDAAQRCAENHRQARMVAEDKLRDQGVVSA
jgi:uncharacterized coiled-coil DUF342 family protein